MRVHEYLDDQAQRQPEADFAICGAARLSYGEALAGANRVAGALVAGGYGRGTRLAILSKNCMEMVLAYFGAFKAGVVPVPLNYRLAPHEWSQIVTDSQAKLLLVDGEFCDAIEALRGDLVGVERFIAIGATARSGWENFDAWAADPPATFDREVGEDDDLYQIYTSGTTGEPKGAVLTHRAIVANLDQLAAVASLSPGERYLIVTPLCHAAAMVAMLNCVAWGGTVYLQRDFQPAEVVRALSEERIAGTTLVPTMIRACLADVPDVAERSYNTLRFIAYGASPIAEQTLRRAMEVFGCDFSQRYGTTETTVLAWLTPEDHHRALAGKPRLLLSAGRPLSGTEIRVVDKDGRPLPSGEIGQFAARGPQLMRGYWNNPEATAEAMRGGWMHTGDAGVIDEEGYVYIQDRAADMIVSGGQNVYPREIEQALSEHPAVAEVAVIGVPDREWGESVKAIVALAQGSSTTAEELIDYCRGRIAGFKRPRSVDFVERLPRTATGKVLKRVLREPYWRGHRRRVS